MALMRLAVLYIIFITLSNFAFSKKVYLEDFSADNFNKEIELANPHDTIVVKSGNIKAESIIIRKPVCIIGENYPSISGKGKDHILKIYADSVVIQGMEFNNSGYSYVQDRAAIRLDSSSRCNISNNRFVNTMFAVYAARSKYLIISSNIFEGKGKGEAASGNAVHLWYCNDVIVRNNDIAGHRDGIYLEFTKGVKISENTSHKNIRYGLHFMFSHNAEYKKNIFLNNGSGVAVMYTSNVLMEDNIFQDNLGAASYGLLLKDIKESKIINNKILNNSTGIYIEGGGKNTFVNNIINNNAWAIRILASSSENSFKNNIIVANSFDLSTNSTMNSNSFESNYWDKYSGYDINKDGFGDVPYYPVRLFAFIVEKNPPLIILLNSFFMFILDMAENIIPSITPPTMIDNAPLMKPIYDKI